MDDNKKLICAAAGALGALVAVSATVFAIKQKVRPKKSNFGGRYFYVKIQL